MADLTRQQAEELAAALDLRLDDVPVCLACLSFVVFPLDRGEEREASREARTIAPDLWAEGLALPLQAALERARRRGVPHAAEAIEDVESRGFRARIVPAVVLRLAAEEVARLRASRVGGPNGRVMILRPSDGDFA